MFNMHQLLQLQSTLWKLTTTEYTVETCKTKTKHQCDKHKINLSNLPGKVEEGGKEVQEQLTSVFQQKLCYKFVSCQFPSVRIECTFWH